MLTLMVICLPSLSGCSNRPVEPTYIYTKEKIEASLLEAPCTEVGAGETVRTLAHGFVINRSCLRAYEKLLDGLRRLYTDEGVKNDTREPHTSRKQ